MRGEFGKLIYGDPFHRRVVMTGIDGLPQG